MKHSSTYPFAPQSKSLPVWERGLKLGSVIGAVGSIASLPVWERGLKHFFVLCLQQKMMSLPVWERGLKHVIYPSFSEQNCRSPCGSVD